MRELLETQENDRACDQAALTIDLSKFILTIDTENVLVLISPADGAAQKYIPVTLPQQRLYLRHHFS